MEIDIQQLETAYNFLKSSNQSLFDNTNRLYVLDNGGLVLEYLDGKTYRRKEIVSTFYAEQNNYDIYYKDEKSDYVVIDYNG